jgi:DNA-binding GntR family transcriptional regulator
LSGTTETRLSKIAQRPMRERVVDSLRNAILDGKFAPGERLIEAELARELGVSRGPVRDAMRVLAAEGIVELNPYKSAAVAQLTPEDILEILDLRMMLEGYAARRAATMSSDQEIAHLRSVFDEMQDLACGRELSALVKKDMEFHENVCRLSRSSRLLQVWRLFAGQIEMFLNLSDKVYMNAEVIAQMHAKEMVAIESRDPDRAEKAARDSLRETAETIVTLMREDA